MSYISLFLYVTLYCDEANMITTAPTVCPAQRFTLSLKIKMTRHWHLAHKILCNGGAMCAMCWSCLVFRNIFNAFWFWWLCSTRRGQQQYCGSIIHSQPAFHFNPGLTVSMLLPFKDRVMTKLLVINILYCSKVAAGCLGIWAGSSHCLGWPVLHCVPVDDYGTVIYRGCNI